MSLLVVEADPGGAASLTSQLGQLGYAPLPASNLKTAVRVCDHAHPELIVCCRLNWAESLAGQFRYIPVVLASNELSAEVLFKALRAGLADVWRMPVKPAHLKKRVTVVLDRVKAVAGQLEERLDQFVQDLQRDQRAGRHVQLGMLPPNPMAIDRYRLHHRIAPSLILSGDFVDYFRISDRYFAFYVADVSGHGASSAFVTVLLKNFSRRLRREHRPAMLQDPGLILQWLNQELLDQHMDKHVALLIAVCDLEQDSFHFANAGHYPQLVHVSDGEAFFLNLKGKPIGLFDTVSYEVASLHISAGDRLVVCTDGALDLLPEKTLAEKEQTLLQAVKDNDSMDSLWRSLEIDEREDAHGPDDITCLMVKRES